VRIEGISAIVTGGASGLGFATAKRLVDGGAKVALVDLGTAEGETAAKELGDAASFIAADVTDEVALNAALDAAEGNGPLRAVVHCAGRGGDRFRIIDKDRNPGSLDTFMDIQRINLGGTYNVLRLAAARMATNEPVDGDRGAFVLTASVAAFEGQIGQTSYAASKGGVRAITIVAARDLASWGIRVNTIAPGTFDTPMLARLRDDIRQKLADSIPQPKRLGEPDDFGHMAVSLIENEYVNGHVVRLDGAIRMAPR
jgi:NAD(P)-dependent dehydrogenase (short-subunit alcohol dehydrogenase family)